MASVQNSCKTFDEYKYSQKDSQMLNHQVHALEEEKMRSYIEHELVNVPPFPEAQLRTIVDEQQKEIDKEIVQHEETLDTWNGTTTKLSKRFSEYKQININLLNVINNETPNGPQIKPKLSVASQYDNEESKSSELYGGGHTEFTATGSIDIIYKKPYYELDSTNLLRQSTNCTNLLTQQQTRTDLVAEHIVPLNKTTKDLMLTVKQYNADIQSVTIKYTDDHTRYKNLKKKRIEKQAWVKELMKELNETIDAENEANEKWVKSSNDLNVLKLENNKYEKLLERCASSIAAYVKYMEDVNEAGDEINRYFSEQIECLERNWTKWSSEDVVNYIKYLNQTQCDNKIKLSNKINLNVVKGKIAAKGVCGNTLDGYTKATDWIQLGVDEPNDRTQIVNRMQELIKTYPRIERRDSDSDNETYVLIPEKFKCPISGKIMMDPVKCSDDETYERENVMKYIQENGKLPGAAEPYDKKYAFMVKNGMLKKEIDEFIRKYPHHEWNNTIVH